MHKHRMNISGRRAGIGVLASGACALLVLACAGCTALIDRELSGKASAAGTSAASGSGDEGGVGGTGGTGGTGGQTESTTASTTTSSTTTSSTTTGSGGGCTGSPDCTCPDGCTLPHASAKCSMDMCHIEKCDEGFADCNDDRLDGCEADLLHESKHCGKCSKSCKDEKTCEEGMCQ